MLSLTSPDRGTRTSIYYQVASVVCMVPTYCFGYDHSPSPPGQDRVRRVRPALPSTTTAALLLDTEVVEIISFVFALVVGGWVDIWVNAVRVERSYE